MALETDYELLSTLGEGSFGKVYKARHRRSNDEVAVKQIKLGSKSWDEACKSTELQALRALRHPFIVRLRELLRSPKDGSLYYIFEFVDGDLCRMMRPYPKGLDEERAGILFRQLLVGLAHMHQHGFFHRDVKPENVLYNPVEETVRLADFGEARSLRARPPFTDYVGTRWYRAPECLLRDRSYSSPVDIWASGLIFAELLRGTPVFCGTSSTDQLYKILAVLGVPQETEFPTFSRMTSNIRFRVPTQKGCGLSRVLPSRTSPQAQALIDQILVMNPRSRPLGRKCLEHSFFGMLPPLDLERSESRRSDNTPGDTPAGGDPSVVADFGIPSRPGSAVGVVSSDACSPPPYLQEQDGRHAGYQATLMRPPSAVSLAAPAPAPPGPVTVEADLEDFDAELDKILGGDDGPVAAAAKNVDKGTAAVRGDGLRNNSKNAPAPSPPFMGAPPPHATPKPEPSKPVLAAPKVSDVGGEILDGGLTSPGAASVDALLDSLCADFLVDDAEPDPQPQIQRRPQPPAATGGTRSVDLGSCARGAGFATESSVKQPPATTALQATAEFNAILGGTSQSGQGWVQVASGFDSDSSQEAPAAPPVASRKDVGTGLMDDSDWSADDHAEDLPGLGQSGGVAPTSGSRVAVAPQRKDETQETLKTGRPARFALGGRREAAAAVAGGPQAWDRGNAAVKGKPVEPASSFSMALAGVLGDTIGAPAKADESDDPEPEAEVILPGLMGTSFRGGSSTKMLADEAAAAATLVDTQKESFLSTLSRAARSDLSSKDLAAAFGGSNDSIGRLATDGNAGATPTPGALSAGDARPRRPSSAAAVVKTEGDARRRTSSQPGVTAELGDTLASEQANGKSSKSAPWTAEEASELRRIVKMVVKRGSGKEILWPEVCAELGGGRTAKECKIQYNKDYRAHKAAKEAARST
eukprot:TRINITY_DN49219_c0_g1_i1.p1 TRINITY_DN49219_c0_g1~~TRINITY_DN49219_c0_g1_i1.p1  ORF type:complete len:926 (-),score=159.32 TRINITY_DN49219_c0_g1_i1:319-3096(-)